MLSHMPCRGEREEETGIINSLNRSLSLPPSFIFHHPLPSFYSLSSSLSCSAEISAKAPVRLSHDQHDGTDITTPQPGCQSTCVAMTTPACRQEACSEATGREEPRECVRQFPFPHTHTPLYFSSSRPFLSPAVATDCRVLCHTCTGTR